MIISITKSEADEIAREAYASAGYCEEDKVGYFSLISDQEDNEDYSELMVAIYKATGTPNDYFIIIVEPFSEDEPHLEHTQTLNVCELSDKLMEITNRHMD